MDWIGENLIESLLIIGMLLIGIEVLVLGFSTFVIFFVGLAAMITAGLIYVSAVPATVMSAVLSVGVISALAALFLWKPMKRMQSDVDKSQVKNDFIGMSFILTDEVSQTSNTTYRYSGIDWKLSSDSDISAGKEVEVIGTEVGVFHIREKDS